MNDIFLHAYTLADGVLGILILVGLWYAVAKLQPPWCYVALGILALFCLLFIVGLVVSITRLIIELAFWVLSGLASYMGGA